MNIEAGTIWSHWIVLETGIQIKKKQMCRVKCDCGTVKLVHTTHLKRGGSQSCGCQKRRDPIKVGTILANSEVIETGIRRGQFRCVKVRCNQCLDERIIYQTTFTRRKDFCLRCAGHVETGRVFSHWTVLSCFKKDSRSWCHVRCTCGVERDIRTTRLRAGRSTSCACQKRGLKVEDSHWKKVFGSIKHNAKTRSKCCEFVTYRRFRFISQLPCAYCGCDPENIVTVSVTTYDENGIRIGRLKGNPRTYSGIDRVDSSKDYEKGNMLPCCVTCNRAKNVQSLKAFLSYLARHGSTLKEEYLLAQAELIGDQLAQLEGE